MTYPDLVAAPAPISSVRPRRSRPLVPMVLAFSVAIFAADWSADHFSWVAGAIVVVTGSCVGLAFRYASARHCLLSAAFMLVFGYAYVLWSTAYLPAHHISRHLSLKPVALEGQVRRLAKVGANRTTLDLSARMLTTETAGLSVSGRVRITAYDFEPAVAPGDMVRIRHVRLRRPSGFRNPGAFDYGRYLARRSIYVTGSLSKEAQLEVTRRGSGGHLDRLSGLKASLAGHMTRTMAEPAAAITREMVLGLRGSLSPAVREVFSISGTAHLMSVSGLHVGFVYAAIFMTLKPILLQLRFRLLGCFSGGPRPSKLAAAGGLLAVLGYACLIGSNLPTMRATVMIATYVIAYMLDRDGDPWHTTALAALLLLIIHPLSLFDIGFQLSFAGVLAILYAQRFLRPAEAQTDPAPEPVGLASRVKLKVREAVLISTFASLGTAPLMVAAFQRLPLIAPVANIIVVPFASIAVPLALVAAFLAEIIQPPGDFLLWLTGMIVTTMYAIIALVAAIPYAAPRVGAVGWPVLLLAYGTLILMPYSRVSRLARWGAVSGALLISAWQSWPWLAPEGRGQLAVTFLDVGHGDASLIQFPQGSTMLIDGGGSYRDDFDLGERVVAPFLRYQGIRRIDYVVATHPHPDHAKGLGFILKDFRVQQFWDNGAQLSSQWYSDIRREAENRGLYRYGNGADSTAMRIDDVQLERFHPTATFQPAMMRRAGREDAGENNRSLVLKLTYGAISFLFTGDIEHEAESFLLESGYDLHATVVKVPHHGSRTSSSEAFVRAVNPRVAVFSVQRESRFGHPHSVVVERYHALRAHVFRTDQHGAITIRTDGHSIHVVPYLGAPLKLDIPVSPRVAETHAPSIAGPLELTAP